MIANPLSRRNRPDEKAGRAPVGNFSFNWLPLASQNAMNTNVTAMRLIIANAMV
jgi:hypothetical protein